MEEKAGAGRSKSCLQVQLEKKWQYFLEAADLNPEIQDENAGFFHPAVRTKEAYV